MLSQEDRYLLLGKAIAMLYNSGTGIGSAVVSVCHNLIFGSGKDGLIGTFHDFGVLADHLGASVSTTHKTLAVLKKHGIVRQEKTGEWYLVRPLEASDQKKA